MSTSLRTRNTIILSHDGVVIDTASAIAQALTVALWDHCELHFSPLAVSAHMGLGLIEVFDNAVLGAGISLDPKQRTACLQRFDAEYQASDTGKAKAFPHVASALRQFSHRGMRVAVCADCDEEKAKRQLKAAGITDLVNVVCGYTLDNATQPYVARLYGAMQRLDAQPDDAVVVSASAIELLTARSHGIPGVGIRARSRRSFFDGSTPVINALTDLFDVPRETDDWSWNEKPRPMRETYQWLDRLLVAANSNG